VGTGSLTRPSRAKLGMRNLTVGHSPIVGMQDLAKVEANSNIIYKLS
jgi:hypothetical protein